MNACSALVTLLGELDGLPIAPTSPSLQATLGSLYYGEPLDTSPESMLEGCIRAWDLASDAHELAESTVELKTWAAGSFSLARAALARSITRSETVQKFLVRIRDEDRYAMKNAAQVLEALGTPSNATNIAAGLIAELDHLQEFIEQSGIDDVFRLMLCGHIEDMRFEVRLYERRNARLDKAMNQFAGSMVLDLGRMPPEDGVRKRIADELWLALARMSDIQGVAGPLLLAGTELGLRLLDGQ